MDIGFISKRGGFFSANSIHVIPNDQMSIFIWDCQRRKKKKGNKKKRKIGCSRKEEEEGKKESKKMGRMKKGTFEV